LGRSVAAARSTRAAALHFTSRGNGRGFLP
jgi:hypothetical protein